MHWRDSAINSFSKAGSDTMKIVTIASGTPGRTFRKSAAIQRGTSSMNTYKLTGTSARRTGVTNRKKSKSEMPVRLCSMVGNTVSDSIEE